MVRSNSPFDGKLRLQVVFNREWENSVRFFTHKHIKMHPTGTMDFVFDNPFENSNSYSIVEQSCYQTLWLMLKISLISGNDKSLDRFYFSLFVRSSSARVVLLDLCDTEFEL